MPLFPPSDIPGRLFLHLPIDSKNAATIHSVLLQDIRKKWLLVFTISLKTLLVAAASYMVIVSSAAIILCGNLFRPVAILSTPIFRHLNAMSILIFALLKTNFFIVFSSGLSTLCLELND